MNSENEFTNMVQDITISINDEIIDDLFDEINEEDQQLNPIDPCLLSKIKQKETSNDNLTCSICQDIISKNSTYSELECKHSFHTECLSKWLMRDNSCPICRKAFSKEDDKIIFLYITYPNKSILYKSFSENIMFKDFINIITTYIPEINNFHSDKIKNLKNQRLLYSEDFCNKTLKELYFNNGSKILLSCNKDITN